MSVGANARAATVSGGGRGKSRMIRQGEWAMDLFEQHKVPAELDERLRAASLDPSDAKAKEISSVISKYFAERNCTRRADP